MLLGYARVSDSSQRHDLQLDALRAAGCERIFVETASGVRTDRQELAKLLEMARPGDICVCWRLDRIGRSLRHLIEISEDLQRRDIGLRSLTEAIDTTTPAGRFMFSLLGALASMERDVLIERTKAGLAIAKKNGRTGGRPPVIDADKLRAAKAMLAAGTMTTTEVARQLGCAPSTLFRHLANTRSTLDREMA